MNSHVANVFKGSFYHIRALRHVRASLPQDICVTLATALVQSRLDYANSILYGTSNYNLNKLQRVQNTLARTIYYRANGVSAPDLIRKLHWLPIRQRINFKIAVLTYKLLTVQEPPYLHSLLALYQPTRLLRSSDQNLLSEPRTKTSFGSRAFSVAAPKVWNEIPISVRRSESLETFHRELKTFYFSV